MDGRTIAISGVVQGVGFRPFVYRLASRLHVSGTVRNETGGVVIEAEGDPAALALFEAELLGNPPPLARIASVRIRPHPPRGHAGFRIETSSASDAGPVFVGPDIATCDACLAELLDPSDRRFGYPFLNCTNCGPRLTIVLNVPYDRDRTTMAAFPMCTECRAEYDDPTDRRFHAQPTACRACGPKLSWESTPLAPRAVPAPPNEMDVSDGCDRTARGANGVLSRAVEALRSGKIVAVKGLGGYHLACDARRGDVVAELRRRKGRDEKPFAMMVADIDAAKLIAEVSDAEAELLTSPRRPIVLLARKAACGVAPEVAPGNPNLGVMLPYTPLHHLLMREFDAPLVLSSGNPSDEPIAFDDADAHSRLAGIADAFLTHNRPIHLRGDDSVTRIVAGEESPIRRSRGYAPQPITLPIKCEQPTLALGGQLKSTFALGRGRHAILSHHLGDLDHYEAYRTYTQAVRHYEKLFGVRPAVIAHDLHPDYASTQYALERAREDDSVRLVPVQHHHAHLASCLADHGLTGPAIGVIFDGTGFGTDGTVWGGEFLCGDFRGFRRASYLRPVAMPGGERAIREPWRMALAYLLDAREDAAWLTARLASPTARAAELQIAKRLNSPLTSSAGRLFDAVASLAGVRDHVGYEGQAAIELEGLATGVSPDGSYPFEVAGEQVDTRPLIASVVADVRRGTPKRLIARRFHSAVVEIIVRVCRIIRDETNCDAVALSGGVFLNALLSEEVSARLSADAFRVYRQRQVPPNDGGLCLGQLAVASVI